MKTDILLGFRLIRIGSGKQTARRALFPIAMIATSILMEIASSPRDILSVVYLLVLFFLLPDSVERICGTSFGGSSPLIYRIKLRFKPFLLSCLLVAAFLLFVVMKLVHMVAATGSLSGGDDPDWGLSIILCAVCLLIGSLFYSLSGCLNSVGTVLFGIALFSIFLPATPGLDKLFMKLWNPDFSGLSFGFALISSAVIMLINVLLCFLIPRLLIFHDTQKKAIRL